MLKRQFKFIGLALAVATAINGPAMASALEVVLRLKGSEVEFSGALKAYNGRHYVLETAAFGVLSLEAERFECASDRCADLAPGSLATVTAGLASTGAVAVDRYAGVERMQVHGSDTLGRELFPALVREYARSLGGSVRQLVGADPGRIEYRLTDASGGPAGLVEVVRAAPTQSFSALASGEADIVMSGRAATSDEAQMLARLAGGNGVETEHVVALDGLAVVVSPDSPMSTISLEQLAGLLTGRPDPAVQSTAVGNSPTFYMGPEGPAALSMLADVGLESATGPLAASVRQLDSEAAVSDAVVGDPNAIGLVSYAFLRNARALPLTGPCGLSWRPDEFSIKSEEYPLSRRLYLYAAADKDKPVGRLLAFAATAAAQATIADSQLMDQAVMKAAVAGEERVADWKRRGGGSPFENALAEQLRAETADAQRLSLTFRFALGSSLLDAKARQDIARLLALLQTPQMRGKTVMLIGFTDGIGEPEANAVLARRRANQVREAILAAAPEGAIDAGRLIADGYGTVAPVACNAGVAGLMRNRRVEVWVRDRAPEARSAAVAPPERVIRRKLRAPKVRSQRGRRQNAQQLNVLPQKTVSQKALSPKAVTQKTVIQKQPPQKAPTPKAPSQKAQTQKAAPQKSVTQKLPPQWELSPKALQKKSLQQSRMVPGMNNLGTQGVGGTVESADAGPRNRGNAQL